jgi:hypothetical protein
MIKREALQEIHPPSSTSSYEGIKTIINLTGLVDLKNDHDLE